MREPAPADWATARLDAIAQVRLGRQRSPKNHAGDSMVRYLRAANVTWHGIDVTDVNTMNFTPEEVTVYRLLPGDVLLSEASGSASDVGKPAIWRSDMSGEVCFQNTLLRVRPANNVDSEFLYFRMLHECLRGGFARSSRGVGIHHLGAAKLAGLELAFPGTAEQRRIVERLKDAFEDLNRAQATLETLAQRVTQLKASALTELYASALAVAGADVPLGEVAQISGGLQKQPARAINDVDPGWPFLRVANVGRRSLSLDDVHRVRLSEAEKQRTRLEPGDLLVVEGNGSPDHIGRAATWTGQIDPCTHQNHLIRVRPSGAVRPEYLELVWSAPRVVEQLKAVASTTSGLYTLSTKKVGAVRLPVPPLATQERLVARARQQIRLADHAQLGFRPVDQGLTALRRSLLNAAFSGQLAGTAPDDEAGTVLLQRIQVAREAQRVTAKQGRGSTVRRTGAAVAARPVQESA